MTSTTTTARTYSCECGFMTSDLRLLENHSCDVQAQGNRCEDFPCCGHEAGDCNGLLYGSDEAIKEAARAHLNCDHEAGHYACEDEDWDGDEDQD
jgi:hypothetical protein